MFWLYSSSLEYFLVVYLFVCFRVKFVRTTTFPAPNGRLQGIARQTPSSCVNIVQEAVKHVVR